MKIPSLSSRKGRHLFLTLSLIPLIAGTIISLSIYNSFNHYRDLLVMRMKNTSQLHGQLIAEQIRGRLSSLDLLLLMLENRARRYDLTEAEGGRQFSRYIQNRALLLIPVSRIFLLDGEGRLEYTTDDSDFARRGELLSELRLRHSEQLLSFSLLPWEEEGQRRIILSRRLDAAEAGGVYILAAEINESLLFDEIESTDTMELINAVLVDEIGQIYASWENSDAPSAERISPDEISSLRDNGMIGGTYTVSVGSSLATLIQIKDFSLFLGLNSDMGTQIDTWRTDRNRTLNFILFGSIVISLFVFVVLWLISEKNIIRARIMEELEQKVRERTGELNYALQEIEKMALQDPLTGILNRRGMFKILDREYARIERYGGNLTLVMCDIDHFKRINDVLGHGEGDRALCYTVKSLQDNLRKTDTISRWGGEEFLIALSDIDHEQAMAAAEKLRRSFEIHPWKEDMMVTVSLGVASLKKGDTIEELIRRADQAMYRAKETRNAVRG